MSDRGPGLGEPDLAPAEIASDLQFAEVLIHHRLGGLGSGLVEAVVAGPVLTPRGRVGGAPMKQGNALDSPSSWRRG